MNVTVWCRRHMMNVGAMVLVLGWCASMSVTSAVAASAVTTSAVTASARQDPPSPLAVQQWPKGPRHAPPASPSHDHPLARAKVYLAAGDYRRAIDACQQHLNHAPSVDSYVALLYVYHALDGYVEWLAERDDWVKVGQVALSLFTRGTTDLVDPPDMMPRMAKELLREGIRQHYDMVAGMANRLDHARADRLWLEVRMWQRTHPKRWWSGIPTSWRW